MLASVSPAWQDPLTRGGGVVRWVQGFTGTQGRGAGVQTPPLQFEGGGWSEVPPPHHQRLRKEDEYFLSGEPPNLGGVVR